MGRRRIIPATCHPERERHRDGLCAVCWFDEQRAQEKIGGLSKTKQEERQALVTLHQNVEHVVNMAKQAKAILRENLPRYAELHLTAAEIAASEGDSKPAWEALQGIKGEKGERVVEPVKDGGGGSGIKIMIGVQIGGLPVTTDIVESS
jgi:hypothetical protein